MQPSANATPVLAWLGHTEILIIGGVAVLMLFANRIPGVMRALGRGITQFRRGLKDSGGPDGEGARKPPAGDLPPPGPRAASAASAKEVGTAEPRSPHPPGGGGDVAAGGKAEPGDEPKDAMS